MKMNKRYTGVGVTCLRLLLKPVVRFCLRHSLHVQDILESAKVLFVEIAAEELENNKKKPNIARLSAMTGLQRREVMRIYRDADIKEEPRGLVRRIIGQWQQDRRFLTKSRKPKVLSFDGPDSEFRMLCEEVSNDITAGTVFNELERIGAVKKVRNGVKLLARAYVPTGDVKAGFGLLSDDIEDLSMAVEENILLQPDPPHMHVKTEYDNISPDSLEKIRDWIYREGSALHQKARNFISQFDQDINPSKDGTDESARVVLGSFSYITEPEQAEE